MGRWGWVGWGASFSICLAPVYFVERLTNLFFLDGNHLYGTMSGLRTELFVASILLAGVASGAIQRSLLRASSSVIAAMGAFFLFVYWLCDPRICYSTGIDGLEPLRMGILLGAIGVCGASLGLAIRRQPEPVRSRVLSAFCALLAVGFYPMVFTMAGTRLMGDLHPWAPFAVMLLQSWWTASTVARSTSRRTGLAVTMAGWAALAAISAGMASWYLQEVATGFLLLFVASMLGALFGALRGGVGVRRIADATRSRAPVIIAVGLVLVMTVGIIPDAVNGLEPDTSGRFTGPVVGTPVYAGGYMDSPLGYSHGVAVNVSFAGTGLAAIQPDNFIAAGIGAHSPGCCVDGIDYGYRFDLYLFHNGTMAAAASAWEICDHNAACGGHPWKFLMFDEEKSIGRFDGITPVYLRMVWVGRTVVWSYAIGTGGAASLSSFVSPDAENAYFNLGALGGFSAFWNQGGSYFLQFGVSSRYPIGNTGWKVYFDCPAFLAWSGSVYPGWTCIQRAKTLQGDQSFWKALWRWGEPYPSVVEQTYGNYAVSFSYSPTRTMQSFERLW
ncbi:MAG: hypothetical protein HY296_00870 [Thaumarchaeota archaeon]|nr:hypothetical protein [Nitrososphaerota archaeon]